MSILKGPIYKYFKRVTVMKKEKSCTLYEKNKLPLVIVTSDEKNDLLGAVLSNFSITATCKTVSEALGIIEGGSQVKGIMILADKYPSEMTSISEREASEIKALGLRVYIEYPSGCEKLGICGYGETECADYQRAVVTAPDALGIEKYSLLYIHGARYVKKTDISSSYLVCAKVAGYDVADFGLTDCAPSVLLELSADGNTLIASTKLSQFISARYAPYKRWQALWKSILGWLSGEEISYFEWEKYVHSKYDRHVTLPSDSYRDSVRLNSEWYLNSGVLYGDNGENGIREGFASGKNFDEFGRQKMLMNWRADCIGESVGALALASRLLGEEKYGKAAYKVMKWLLTESLLTTGARADKESSEYGLFSWHNRAYDQYYGDDNAKSVIGLILAAEALKTNEFDKRILEAIIGNFRTTGKNGFRDSRVLAEGLQKQGWKYYYNSDTVYYSAHFEALPWATYLWAYDRTGYAPLYERTLKGISMMMTAYKNTMSKDITDKSIQWRWTNGLQQERAKMIMPLAFLVRISPTEEHISWLDTMISDLMAWQDKESGALADAFGEEWEGNGLYGPFTKNSDYGNHESPVIQKNGDPCSDSLYTASFAMLTLLEAQKAMEAIGNDELAEKYRAYTTTLSDYHVRIQQICKEDPAYNGVWFRGFDFEKWETYGSDGDAGWGIWCIETGWSQSWISSALSLQAMGTSMWDYTRSTTANAHIESVISHMIGDENTETNK